MKKFALTAALAALAVPAFAGAGEGYRCENACPLAVEANAHRAYGTEAQTASLVVRAEVVREVEANLARI